MSDSFGSSPQFDTAEFKQNSPGDVCGFCGLGLSGSYYRVNGKLSCEGCARRAQADLPAASNAVYLRALAFGIGGAILGLAIYAAVIVATGWTIGYLALAVGFIVAKAMMLGSGGIGGRKYQITAVVLTYAAISMAMIPVMIVEYSKQHKAEISQSQKSTQGDSSDPSSATSEDSQKAPLTLGQWLGAIGALAGIGLISPFLALSSPVHGLIGLFILWIGLSIAWRMAAGTQRVAVEGPYSNT